MKGVLQYQNCYYDELEEPRRLIRDDRGYISFRIDLPVGAEIDEVVTNIQSQVLEIISRLR